MKRFIRSPAIWLIFLLFTNTAFGDENYFYPGQGSSADNASFRVFDPRGLAFIGYLSGRGDFSQSITGGLGFELREKFSSLSLELLSGSADGGGSSLRFGLSRIMDTSSSSGELKFMTASASDFRISVPYLHKVATTDLKLFVGGTISNEIALAATFSASDKKTQTTADSDLRSDGTINYHEALWAIGWRHLGHQFGISFQPTVNVNEPDQGSEAQARSASLSYARVFDQMNFSAALTWHGYADLDSGYDNKMSYDFSAERRLGGGESMESSRGGTRLGIDVSWAPAYYGTIGGVDVGSLGGGGVVMRCDAYVTQSLEIILRAGYEPGLSKSEGEGSVTYSASRGDFAIYGVGLRKSF